MAGGSSATTSGSSKSARQSASSKSPDTSFAGQTSASSRAGPSSASLGAGPPTSNVDAMAITPFIPNAPPSFYDDLKLQLDGSQPNVGAGPMANGSADLSQMPWNMSNGVGAGAPTANSQGAASPATSVQGMPGQMGLAPDTSSMVSNSRPTTAQIPTHIVKNNPFLNKLRSMVDDAKTNSLIRWTPDGDTFIVPNVARFSEEVLPRFFKHNRFSSFVRQLNMYGFHKVPHLQQGALKTDPGQDTELWEFRNDNFKRDHPELLLQMQRKKGTRSDDDRTKGRESEAAEDDGGLDNVSGALTRTGHNDNEISTMQMASVWNAIQAIQQAQQGINDNLRHLHNSNAELYREAAEQRARSKKQEETINKMLRFLAGIFGAQDADGISDADRRHGKNASTAGDAADRNRRVFLRPYKKGRGRLMIGDSSNSADAEGLELPADEADNIFDDDEATPQGRITEARSNSNSPREGGSPTQRFQHLSSTPENRPDVVSTPGGSNRRLSSQAQQQIMQALSRGDAQQWLASLFGQQQSGNAQGLRSRNDGSDNGSFKLDPQMLANLQSIFGGQGGVPTSSDEPGYFGAGPSQNGFSDGSQAAWSGSAYANPSAAIANQEQAQNRFHTLNQNGNHLQNISQDANTVQQAVNHLVQGLQITPGGSYPSQDLNVNAQMPPPQPADQSSASELPQPSSEIDVDSLLKEFLHAPGSASSGPTPGDMDDFSALVDGQTPSFAFSPGPSAGKDEHGTFDGSANAHTRGGAGGSNTATTTSTNTPRDSPQLTSRKRKPTAADDEDGDVEMPHAKSKTSK